MTAAKYNTTQKLGGLAPLAKDPPPTSSTTLSKKQNKKHYTWHVTPDTWHLTSVKGHLTWTMGRWTLCKNFRSQAPKIWERGLNELIIKLFVEQLRLHQVLLKLGSVNNLLAIYQDVQILARPNPYQSHTNGKIWFKIFRYNMIWEGRFICRHSIVKIQDIIFNILTRTQKDCANLRT